MVSHALPKYARIAIPIYGVTCWGSDAPLINKALASIPGVANVHVNPVMEMAYLQYDPCRCGIPEFASAIEQLGFKSGEASIRSFQ